MNPPMTRRLRACVEAWPGCYTGGYDPKCCRWPKSCSATVYGDEVADADLEPAAPTPERPHPHEGPTMTDNVTSWSLHLTRYESGSARESTIAQTITEDPALMAATLRAAADRLDPPKPVRPVTRGQGRDAEGFPLVRPALIDVQDTPARMHTPGCESIHAVGTPCLPPRRTRITPDGCGPEHTYIGSCALREGGPIA